MAGTILSNLYDKYQRIVPNPAMQFVLLSMLGVTGASLLRKPINNVIRYTLKKIPGNNPAQIDKDMDQLEQDKRYKWGVPLFLGFAPAVVATATQFRPNQPWYGMKQWGLEKNASLWADQGYQPVYDLNLPVDTNNISYMIKNNPMLKDQDYARNLGVSIVRGADNINGKATLGSVFDSAVNKFDSKLTFDGLAAGAVKTMVGSSLAGMFTDAVGTIMGVPQYTRNKASTAAAWGTALYNILT